MKKSKKHFTCVIGRDHPGNHTWFDRSGTKLYCYCDEHYEEYLVKKSYYGSALEWPYWDFSEQAKGR